MVHVNQPGHTIPEQRFNPEPFYYDMPAPIYRWNQWRGIDKWDAFQRWFYTCFCGRTMESIWESECETQTEGDIKNFGDYSDPTNWNIPWMTHPAVGAEYLGQPHAYANYFCLDENVRPANPKTALAAQTTADDFYMATRHAYPRAGFRIAMKLPSAAEVAAMHAAHGAQSDTYMGMGFEVNSQGEGGPVAYFHLYDTGAALTYGVTFRQFGYHGTTTSGGTNYQNEINRAVTINNPDVWCWYYLEYDPPVFRFVQPIAGQTWFASTDYADCTEITIPNEPAYGVVQPFIFNESNAYTGDHLSWFVGQWAIWQLHNTGTRYLIRRRDCAITACGNHTAIWDSGAAEQILVHIRSNGCGCTYTVEWTDEGEDQEALYPEVRTWRRIDDADHTGVTDTPTGIASLGLFGAARFYRASITMCGATANANYEEICFTGNKTGRG